MTCLDTTPLVLACGARIYRAVFGSKQAACWYSTSFPTEGVDSTSPFDLRRAVNPALPARLLDEQQLLQATQLTLADLRRNCLTATYYKPSPVS